MKREERIIIKCCRKMNRDEILRAAETAALETGVPLGMILERVFKETAMKIKEERMKHRTDIENEIKKLGIRFPNGTVNKPYIYKFKLPIEKISNVKLSGEKDLGLSLVVEDDGICTLTGVPKNVIDTKLTLTYETIENEPLSSLDIPIAFNPNPRDLWRNIPTDKDVPYYKPDEDSCYLKVQSSTDGSAQKDVVAASQRGRSHAQEGKPRDDHFGLYHDEESDWYVLAVADGAGSAKYSRKGSEIACATVIEHCRKLLKNNYEFEEDILSWASDREDDEKRTKVTKEIINIVFRGAVKAHEAVRKVAEAHPDSCLKDYSTTLMFVICKKYDFGWFLASFWVGDGAMAIYDEKRGEVKLLGTPDEGEFSGQTRFLTMPEIFHDKDVLSKRMRMTIVPDFTALFLMTDGISDPMFETDKNLNDYSHWKIFYNKLKNGFPEDEIGGVELTDDNENSDKQLLKWLDFWSPGNHDDRTIAILY